MEERAESNGTRQLLLLGVVLAVVVAAWLWLGHDAKFDPPPSTRVSAAASERATPAEPVSESPKLERSPVETAVEAKNDATEPLASNASATKEVADLEARDGLDLKIVDALAQPIFDAEVKIEGLRKEGDEGSWYGMNGGETVAKSDHAGHARIDYRRWVDIDGKSTKVDLGVAHPDFVPWRDDSFAIGPGEHVIVLQQGSMVMVSGWLGSRDHVVPEITIDMDWAAQLGADAWRRESAGRWSTTRLGAGDHVIGIRHSSPELGELASFLTPFSSSTNGRVDLELELHPLATLRGRLDDDVPRPIVGGHVMVSVYAWNTNTSSTSEHEADVRADGTFEIAGLRPGSGKIIAFCDGWSSKLVPPRTLDESNRSLAPDAGDEQRRAALADAQSDRFVQPIDATDAQDVVVAMERTGDLEVVVRDESGSPLAGASVYSSPNVFWTHVGSGIFPWGDWDAVTDAGGVARIANLPPDESLWYGAGSSTHQLRKAERDHNPSAVIASGKTTRVELVLEKIPQ
ncbi:MAG: carboxypeptidase-like regulatory domain-containing protein [Planctomycetes bacterium]|nr:carboxypeptidase-like regulatory domain-containing protein [Planctomycetota bacterium]